MISRLQVVFKARGPPVLQVINPVSNDVHMLLRHRSAGNQRLGKRMGRLPQQLEFDCQRIEALIIAELQLVPQEAEIWSM